MSADSQPWGWLGFVGHDESLTHPKDRNAIEETEHLGNVARLVRNEGEFLRVQRGDREFLVVPSAFHVIKPDVRPIGSYVILQGGGAGQIYSRGWHDKREEVMYFLVVDGKEKSKRYWESDFTPLKSTALLLTAEDRAAFEALEYDPSLEPSFEMLKSCLVWADELPPRISSIGYELVTDLLCFRSFVHRGLPKSEWGLDPQYFQSTWEAAQSIGLRWPGFQRLELSKKDQEYLQQCLQDDRDDD